MPNHLKKHGFSIPVTRLFTRPDKDAYSLIHFADPEVDGDISAGLERPENWSLEATALLGEAAAFAGVPRHLKPIEENTVPSWLWQRHGDSRVTSTETSARQIFDRVVGSATYTGWKLGMFSSEGPARAFFDEARYALSQRFIAFDPKDLTNVGIAWAYGTTVKETRAPHAATASIVDITNAMIDSVVGGRRDRNLQTKWHKITAQRPEATTIDLRFTDVAADWGMTSTPRLSATLDIMACRHNDGTVNIEALRQLSRLLVFLVDLQNPGYELAISISNLAPLLMALAIPYDSEAGRATVAAISAIATAEAYVASAELAALRGVGPSYAAARESMHRRLRNHRRSAYGEHNDYEKVSVVPVPLNLVACADLALAAAARSVWDDAIQLAQNHGLRHVHVTALNTSPTLALFNEGETQGLDPLRSLIITQSGEGSQTARGCYPVVAEGLTRLGYDQQQIKGILRHIAGAGTLDKAPLINHTALRARGFGASEIAKIEDYLSQTTNIRFAFTPWVLGEAFCRKTLKVSAKDMENPRFNLLSHMGFSPADIASANAYCYGHHSVKGAKELRPQHAAVFALASDISPEAQIRMAAAAQSFITGDTGLHLTLPADLPAETAEKLLIGAWRQGVKTLSIAYDAALNSAHKAPAKTATLSKRKTPRSIKPSAFVHAKAAAMPVRKSRPRTAPIGSGPSTSSRTTKTSRRNWGS